MDTPFWLDEPTILFKSSDIRKLWPSCQMTSNEKLNAITRTVLLLTLVGYLCNMTSRILLTGLITLGIIIIMHKIRKQNSSKEGFTYSQYSQYNPNYYTLPTKKNPVMNVMLPERKDNPARLPATASYDKTVESEINAKTKEFIVDNFDNTDNINNKLFKDLGDNFNFDQSMRTWYTTANTQIPNAQKDFAEWCYGDMISCKEGNDYACLNKMPYRLSGT